MTDYNSVQDMPDDVLKGKIKIFESVIAIIKKRKGNVEVIENLQTHIQLCKDEIVRRQPDSLYITNLDGTVELVDDIGEII